MSNLLHGEGRRTSPQPRVLLASHGCIEQFAGILCQCDLWWRAPYGRQFESAPGESKRFSPSTALSRQHSWRRCARRHPTP